MIEQQIPTGKIKQFGPFGIKYIVEDIAEKLPNGDILVNIMLLETGQKDLYKLSSLLEDPDAE